MIRNQQPRILTRVGAGAVWRRVGTLASPPPVMSRQGFTILAHHEPPPGATQASPLHTTLPPPLRGYWQACKNYVISSLDWARPEPISLFATSSYPLLPL